MRVVYTSVAGNLGARCPRTSQLEGALRWRVKVRGGSLEQPAWPGPDAKAEAIAAGRVGGYKNNYCDNCARRRRQANSSGDIAAGRLPRYAHAANRPLDEPSDPGEQQKQSRWGSYCQC